MRRGAHRKPARSLEKHRAFAVCIHQSPGRTYIALRSWAALFHRREKPGRKKSARESLSGSAPDRAQGFNPPPRWRPPGRAWCGSAPRPRGGGPAPWRYSEGVPVTLRRARRQAAVQPAAAVRHRRRPAPAPAPSPRAASRAAVHGQSAMHGVDPLISVDPHPPESRPRRPPPARRDGRGRAPPSPSAGPCRGGG